MTRGFQITGLDDVQKMLNDMAPREARNLMRATIHGVAGDVAKSAKTKVRSKTVKKALKTKRIKSHPDKPSSGVYVTRGKNAKHDAYFWHWIEYGTKNRVIKKTGVDVGAMPETPFVRPAVQEIRASFETIMVDQFGKKLEKKLAREAKKRAGK